MAGGTVVGDLQVLYQPDRPELGYLPEGPIGCGSGEISWVAIQHGPEQNVGSLNVLDPAAGFPVKIEHRRSYPNSRIRH